MKKIKVFFNHIDTTRMHSVYRSLLEKPPLEYVNIKDKLRQRKEGSCTSKKRNITYYIGKSFVNIFNIPTINIVNTDCDLIHSAQCIPISKKPYVIDFEHISALGGFNIKRVNNWFFKFLLKKFFESKRCKKILPWSIAAKKSLLNLIDCSRFKDKIEVIYPAVSIHKKKKKKDNKIRILYVAYDFYRKGGDLALDAFLGICDKFKNVEIYFVCKNPGLKLNNKKVHFLGLVPNDMLMKRYFPLADIFVYPTFHDTFGYVILEAMSFGLPVIVLDDFAVPELVKNGENGFVIKGFSNRWYDKKYHYYKDNPTWQEIRQKHDKKERARIVKDILNCMEKLVSNNSLREKISENNRKLVENGKFSIKERNKRLLDMYNN